MIQICPISVNKDCVPCPSITDLDEATTLSIISSLLTDGETSPFYTALLEANFGSDYSPVVG